MKNLTPILIAICNILISVYISLVLFIFVITVVNVKICKAATIDTSILPVYGNGNTDYKITKHTSMGLLEFPTTTKLMTYRAQKTWYEPGIYIRSVVLKPLNADVLVYLLGHTDLIPVSWRGDADNTRTVIFWGTIYNHLGRLFVRGLYLSPFDNQWTETVVWLDEYISYMEPAVTL